MSESRPEAVLFDFNGVLVDDEPLHQEAFAEVLARHGHVLEAREYFQRYLGLNDRDFLNRFHEDRGQKLSATRLAELVAEKGQAYEARIDRAPLVAGAAEALRDIAGHVPVAVVSGAVRPEIEALLGRYGLLSLVRAIVSAEEVQHGKPSPEGYLLGLERLGDPPAERCLVFEDAPAGIQAARAAGLDCWGIATGRKPEELHEASQVLPSLEGVRYADLQVRPTVLVVAAVLETPEGLFLCKRPETGREPGKWELPGGKVEPGESLADALARELWEELHWKAQVGRELGRVRMGSTELVFLETTNAAGLERSRHHYPEFRFVPVAEALTYDLLEGDRRFLQKREA